MPVLNLVGIQLDITWENKKQNRQHVAELLAHSKPEPGSLIVLPELYETGFSMNSKLVSEDSESSCAFLAEIARNYSSTVLGGLGILNESGSVENQALLFDADGNIKASYSKIHLFSPAKEDLHYSPGSSIVLHELSGFNIAPSICYDLRFPELYRKQVDAGADLFIVIANWPTQRVEHWKALLRARAIENQSFVFAVNRSGQDPSNHYPGCSLLVDPQGNFILEAGSEEAVLKVTIDKSKLDVYRNSFPVLKDKRI